VGLQGADLRYAQLQGDDLNFTRLQGADLENAGLQGADLRYAELQGADLNGALVWRAKVPDKNAAKDVWGTPDAGAKSNGLGCEYPREACDWSAASFAALRTLIIKEVPAGSDRDAALKRIAALEKPVDPADHSTADARGSVDQKLTFDQYFNALAVTLQHELCSAESSPYAIDGVIRQFRVRSIIPVPGLDSNVLWEIQPKTDNLPRAAKLAKAFLDETKCPAARGLPEEMKALLRAIVDLAANPSPRTGTAAR
jgi:hypothetical protein